MLRLTPADAIALRTVAKSLNMTTSAYVASLSAMGSPPAVRRDQERLADVSRLAAAVSQPVDTVRRFQGDLLRLGGLVKSLFTEQGNTAAALAQRHSEQCAEALRSLTDAAERTVPVLGRLEDEVSEIRWRLEQTVEQLAAGT